MFTRRILALAAVLFATLTIGGTSAASAATVATPAYHQTVSAAHTQSPARVCHLWCR